MKANVILLSAILAAGAVACAEKNKEPDTASSASSPSYASHYPDELAAAREKFTQQEQQLGENTGKFQAYPDGLSDTNWNEVSTVYTLADEDGKSTAYVDRMEDLEKVNNFFKEEGPEIGNKVAGSAQYAAKEKGCDADVGGAARAALDKAVEKQMEENLRKESAAHDEIDLAQDDIGKKNVEPLKKQADEISRASYIANVGLARTREDVDRMITESSDVNSTLDKNINELGELSKKEGLSNEQKARITERINAAQAAKAKLDGEVQQAKTLSQEMENRVKKAKDDYQKAFDALKDAVDKKAKESPPPEKGKEKS